MRAFTTLGDGVDRLTLEERPVPEPGPRGVLVKMSAASLNYRDLLVVNGTGTWKPQARRIPVSDGVGTVVAVGEDVSRAAPGDRVAGIFLPHWHEGELTKAAYVDALGGASADGVLADYRVFDENGVVPVPHYLTDIEAATLPVAALTAWHAVSRRSRVQRGERVLIQGTGGVSLAALQFAHAIGAEPIVLSSDDGKLQRARALGASATINYKRSPSWVDEVLAITDGTGVDHVIEVVGGDNLNRSLEAVKLSGTISFIGALAGVTGAINTYQFVTRNVRIHGIETGSREMFQEMNEFIAARQLRPVVDRTFGFREFPDALRYLSRGAHFGKIAVLF